MKYDLGIFIILFSCLSVLRNSAGENYYENNYIESPQNRDQCAFEDMTAAERGECLGICLFFELSSGPELNMIEQGFTGAIIEELIKTIEQGVPAIASSVLLSYLKILIKNKAEAYGIVREFLDKYLFFQTQNNNFVVLIPRQTEKSVIGINKNLTAVNYQNFKSQPNFEIALDEFRSIFEDNDTHAIPQKYIYLSGHGTPATWNTKSPSIAHLRLDQYKEFIDILDQIHCKLLFVSSCYAAGINMVSVHQNLVHSFPIILGNLTDSFSSFYPTINFKNYFSTLNAWFLDLNQNQDFLSSAHFKKTIAELCGNSSNNIPWIKLANLDQFFLIDSDNNLIINHNTLQAQDNMLVKNIKSLLICSINISKTVKIEGEKLPEIISVVPGQSYHAFGCVHIKNHTFYELINEILKIPYEFTKVFFFKKVKIKKPKKKFNKFKIVKVKNLLIVNHGLQTNDVYRNHEIYFQKGTQYHRINIPAGMKLGYAEICSDIFTLNTKETIIDNLFQISKPSDQVLKLIGEFL